MKQKRSYGYLKCIASRNHAKHCHIENPSVFALHCVVFALYKMCLSDDYRIFYWPMAGRCLQCGREYHGYS
jgi:hypothetical protein